MDKFDQEMLRLGGNETYCTLTAYLLTYLLTYLQQDLYTSSRARFHDLFMTFKDFFHNFLGPY